MICGSLAEHFENKMSVSSDDNCIDLKELCVSHCRAVPNQVARTVLAKSLFMANTKGTEVPLNVPREWLQMLIWILLGASR